MNVDICGACGQIRVLVDGVICAVCEDDLFSDIEAASIVRSNIAWRKRGCPVDMSDPWDMVEA